MLEMVAVSLRCVTLSSTMGRTFESHLPVGPCGWATTESTRRRVTRIFEIKIVKGIIALLWPEIVQSAGQSMKFVCY
jgi:hypothetical protein